MQRGLKAERETLREPWDDRLTDENRDQSAPLKPEIKLNILKSSVQITKKAERPAE